MSKFMEISDYERQAMSFCDDSCDNFSHMFIGIVEELGELARAVRHPLRKGEMVIEGNQLKFTDKPTLDERAAIMENIENEAGDIYWMLFGLTRTLGLIPEDIVEQNIKKLEARKEKGTIIGEGDYR